MTRQLGFALRDDDLDLLEAARAEYVSRARSWAVAFCKQRGSVTTDDLHDYCPPPVGIDGRVLGAIMREPQFRATEFVNSRRKECHGRPIRRFVLGATT